MSPKTPSKTEKMKEMILHVCNRSQSDPAFGSVRLQKALYWAEFRYFARHGKHITGLDFQRNTHGPTLRAFLPIAKELRDDRCLVHQEVVFGGRPQKKPLALRPARLEFLNGEELEVLNEAIDDLMGKTGTRASLESHGIAWWATPPGETIPYHMAFIVDRQPTEWESNYALGLE